MNVFVLALIILSQSARMKIMMKNTNVTEKWMREDKEPYSPGNIFLCHKVSGSVRGTIRLPGNRVGVLHIRACIHKA
jgi:hypothetical protein